MNTILILDTEFTTLTQQSSLISLALVSMDGQEFYAEFTDYDYQQLSDWHKEHVAGNLIPDLFFTDRNSGGIVYIKSNTETVKKALNNWLKQFSKIEIWADVLAYDWVLFCELFTGSMQLPANIYYIPFDLATLLKAKGLDPDINRESFSMYIDKDELKRHNALYDARMELTIYKKLTTEIR